MTDLPKYIESPCSRCGCKGGCSSNEAKEALAISLEALEYIKNLNPDSVQEWEKKYGFTGWTPRGMAKGMAENAIERIKKLGDTK